MVRRMVDTNAIVTVILLVLLPVLILIVQTRAGENDRIWDTGTLYHNNNQKYTYFWVPYTNPGGTTLKVPIGQTIHFKFNFLTTEYDSWKDTTTCPGQAGSEGETVTAHWTKTGAGILSDSTSTSGASITYTAPDNLPEDPTVTITVKLDDPHEGSTPVPGGANGNKNDAQAQAVQWNITLVDKYPDEIHKSTTNTQNPNAAPWSAFKTFGAQTILMTVSGTLPEGWTNWNGIVVNEIVENTGGDADSAHMVPGFNFGSTTTSSFTVRQGGFAMWGLTRNATDNAFWDLHSSASKTQSVYIENPPHEGGRTIVRHQRYYCSGDEDIHYLEPDQFDITRTFTAQGEGANRRTIVGFSKTVANP